MQQELQRKETDRVIKDLLSTDMIDGLVEILVQEAAAVQALIKEAEYKQDALLKDDLARLEEVLASEVGLLQDLEHWEAQRLSQMAHIEKQLQSSGLILDTENGISLDELTERLPGSEGQRLLHQGEELRGSMIRLQELNLLNADLLRQSLILANYCLSLITGDTGQTIYGEPGKKERQGYQPGRLDARA